MTLLINLLLGFLIFGYTGYTLVRSARRSKQGKCAACDLDRSCSTSASSHSPF